ncbi:MAG TPA: hypothetical protein VGQ59_01625 [Cyclobacteriaceae bacterium]|nr:hypothetical protein [Cyclobacteriaceae bacterium]
MKNISCLCLFFTLILISSKSHAQKRSDLSCEDIEKITSYALTEFREILGELELKDSSCNYYYSKVNFGIDSTTTLQSCKGDNGKFALHFDLYIGNDDIQASIEFRTLEDRLEKCWPKVKVKELKPNSGYKRVVQFSDNKMKLVLFHDEVKNKDELKPMVTALVVSLL